ncbi:MAG: VWA-like domain-containing protein [Pseudomonadota bacterium]
MAGRSATAKDQKRLAIEEGWRIASSHPFIAPLPDLTLRLDGEATSLGAGVWLSALCDPPSPGWSAAGAPDECAVTVWPNARRRAAPAEWAYAFARLRLHAALNHLDPAQDRPAWRWACWVRAAEMAAAAGVGRRPSDMPAPPTGLPRGPEAALADHFADHPPGHEVLALSLSAPGDSFWRFSAPFTLPAPLRAYRQSQLARGARAAATAAVRAAGDGYPARRSQCEVALAAARSFVISKTPLLASLAAAFDIVADQSVCESLGVAVAAISDEAKEIYFNPVAALSQDEAVFVMAHELLHAGLRHIPRRQGRDPWLWNVACDFIINDWLIEMKLGAPPERIGYLHDPALRGLSAEEVYDRIVRDLRWMRKLKKARTLNGRAPDMLEGERSQGWWRGGGADLDAFYRRALAEGLELHLSQGRGLLPAGLVEEIRALQQPPIPWDVALGHWLDQFFPPLERRRSYARAHRRQGATPDIPRPAWVAPEEARAARVFGVVLDSSGSMDRVLLGEGIGAIASYAMSRDVAAVRLIQCDAAAHDAGYVEPEALLERVEIHGRGGTALMPGVRALERARDFPQDGPILVITDGACDILHIEREHAFLLPEGGRLPFAPKGPVFRMA